VKRQTVQRIEIGILVLLCVVFTGDVCQGAQTRVVLGTSEGEGESSAQTVEMAVDDALEKSIRDSIGQLMPAHLVAEYHDVLMHHFYRKPDHFVLSYKILEETQLASGHMVLLEVVVDEQAIRERLMQRGLLATQGIKGSEGETPVRVTVEGVTDYGLYKGVEAFLADEAGDEDAVTIVEIQPQVCTWLVVVRDATEKVAKRLEGSRIAGSLVAVKTVTGESITVRLARDAVPQTGGRQ